MEKTPIGSFEVTSGHITASDPCYEPGTWCSGSFPAKNGKWDAFLIMSDEGEWGVRVAQLQIAHEHFLSSEREYKIVPLDADIGVDSGQAGFFDKALYDKHGGRGKFFDEESFYGKCCALTTDFKNYGENGLIIKRKYGGVIEWGVVSCSGYGDGGYECVLYVNNDGVAVAAIITFISDEFFDEDYDEGEEVA